MLFFIIFSVAVCERSDSLITPITSQQLPHTFTASISSSNHQSITSAICLIRLHHHPSAIIIRRPISSVCNHYLPATVIRLQPSSARHHHPSATIILLSPSFVCHHHSPATIIRLPPSFGCHHHSSAPFIRRPLSSVVHLAHLSPQESTTASVYQPIRLPLHQYQNHPLSTLSCALNNYH